MDCVGGEGVVRGKRRQLYLNNNKKKEKEKYILSDTIIAMPAFFSIYGKYFPPLQFQSVSLRLKRASGRRHMDGSCF